MASFTTFSDDFTAGTLNARWSTNGDGTFPTAGQAVITTSSKGFSFSGLSSATSYDLSNTSIWMQSIAVPTTGSPFTTFGAASAALSGGINELSWNYDYTAGAWQAWSPGSGHGYAPSGPSVWLRIRNSGGSGGTIFWDYSTNGAIWTNVYSETMSALQSENFGTAIPITAMYFNAYTQASTNGNFIIDNADIAGVAPSGGLIMFLR